MEHLEVELAASKNSFQPVFETGPLHQKWEKAFVWSSFFRRILQKLTFYQLKISEKKIVKKT